MYVRAVSGQFNIGYDYLLFQRLQQVPCKNHSCIQVWWPVLIWKLIVSVKVISPKCLYSWHTKADIQGCVDVLLYFWSVCLPFHCRCLNSATHPGNVRAASFLWSPWGNQRQRATLSVLLALCGACWWGKLGGNPEPWRYRWARALWRGRAATSTVEGHVGMVITSAGSARQIKQRSLCFLVNRKLWWRGSEDFSVFGAAGSAGASRTRLGVCTQSRAPSSSSCPAPLLPFPGRKAPGVCVKQSPHEHVGCGRRGRVPEG